MLVDIEKYGMLDPQTAVNVPGLRRVFETLQKTGDIAAERTFDMKLFADLSYYQESRCGDRAPAGADVTGGICARR
jgi:hypothetical protein